MADDHEDASADGADDHGEDHTHDHHDDHDHGGDRPDYDPGDVDLPPRAPPLRSTAPQSEYTFSQVLTGVAVMVLGVALVFGLPIALL